ncbi:MAG: LicD family protein [Clostridia bacterium]|nr:LicD family protein [Clostridia bacterium]
MNNFNLEEEEREGYLVSAKVKKLWKVELDMLEKVLDICDKNNIKYFASYGTLLGTVRHHGFIPWDDDIDLEMPRNDYERFKQIARKELQDPYFVQCYETEKNYDRSHIQIRNSNTTAILKTDKNNSFNKGIFMDIFPIDNVPDGVKGKIFKLRVNTFKRLINTYPVFGDEKKLKLVIKKIMKKTFFKIFDLNKILAKYEKLLSKYKDEKTKYMGLIYDGFKYPVFEREYYDEYENLSFEYLSLRCPKKYDSMLRQEYGEDYMVPQKKASTHQEFFFDTEKSYLEYTK